MSLPLDDSAIPFTPISPTSSIAKEKEVGMGQNSGRTEKAPDKAVMVEVGKIPETEAETEGYLERIEKEVELQKPVLDDHGQILVTSPTASNPRIVLPVSQGTFLNKANWHLPVTMALRWLLEWTKKIIKKNPEGTVFR
ncbi:MAG: hypothetical protein Q8Q15_02150 [bacterium]|nr:hypothetical protein [bacterium]